MKKILTLVTITLFMCGAGYEGILPDIEADFGYKNKVKQLKAPPYRTDSDSEPKDLLKVPRDNKEFVDIIIKKDKTSEYVNDTQYIIKLLDKLKTYIEDDASIQMFNACVSNYIDHAYHIQNKYKNRPEEHYASYTALLAFAETARESAVLQSESIVYSKYLPYSDDGSKYSKSNLKANKEALLKMLYDTLYVMKNLE